MTARLLIQMVVQRFRIASHDGLRRAERDARQARPVGGRNPTTSVRPGEDGGADRPEPTAVSHVIAEGRVVAYPGAEVVVGTEASGRIVRLEVQEKSFVRKGRPDRRAQRRGPQGRRGPGHRAGHGGGGRHPLLRPRASSRLVTDRPERGDLAEPRRQSPRARRIAGLVAPRRWPSATGSRPMLDKTRIIAPIDGVITARHVQPGETIEVAARIVTIADLNRIRIEAEVDEFDTGRVTLGSDVLITAEGFPDALLEGEGRRDPRFRRPSAYPSGRSRTPDRRPRPAGQDRLQRTHAPEARDRGSRSRSWRRIVARGSFGAGSRPSLLPSFDSEPIVL